MKLIKKLQLGLLLLSLLDGTLAYGSDVYADTLFLANKITPSGGKVVFGNNAYGATSSVIVGDNATGTAYAISLGFGANGDNVGTAVGVLNMATNWGTAVGYRTFATTYGVAIGSLAYAPGLGNVAIGGTTYLAAPPTNPTNNAAMVPSNFVDTVELGRGTATLSGGLNFRGYGIVNSNGVVVASIATTNLTVSGTTYVPGMGDLSMGSFTNRPGM